MNRRDFIKTTALASGGFMLSFHASAISIQKHGTVETITQELGDFLKITSDGTVHFQFLKHEMGQGVSTAMAQIISEELCVDWEKVRIDFPVVDLKKYQNDKNGGYDTGGSCTIIYQWDLLRKAGATARQLLVAAAAQQWKVAVSDCYAKNHHVFNQLSSQSLSFGQLATVAGTLTIPEKVTLKESKDYSLIGMRKSAKLLPKMLSGSLKYGIDAKVQGMLYAVIERCPVFRGTLVSYDATDALKVKGVKKIFTTQSIAGLQTHAPYMPYDIREGVVVVADSFWAANKAREKLKIVWDHGPNGTRSTEDFERLAEKRAMLRTDPTGFVGDANAVSNMAHVRRTVRASYTFPHQLHSCMEPLNCTAHMTTEGCEIWMGSQAPNLIVSEIKRVFGFSEEKIKVHLFPSGGGFGRRYYPDMAVEAAFISQQSGNVPVKMIWTREDDHKCNLAHLFQRMEYQAAIDKDDNLYAWYEKEIRTYTWAAKYQDPQLPGMGYNIPNIRYDFDDLIPDELVHSSAWRGVVGHGRFFSECFLDEVAEAVGKEPVAFRLSLLAGNREVHAGHEFPISTSRLYDLIKIVTEKSGWERKRPAGHGVGIACCPYGNTYCALVAEVSVLKGELNIIKITIAVDCGRVVNPSGAENQIVGGIVWGLTAFFYGGMPIRNGLAIHTNFHQNKLLRMNETPPVEVHFLPSTDDRPWGIGEVSSPLATPAVLNAIYAATGKRIRKVPLDANAFKQ